MKHKPYLKNSIIILPAILMIATVWSYGQVGASVPIATISPTQSSLPTPTTVGEKEQQIHIPDLIGRSLDYATGIWEADEAMPQISVERLSNGPNLVIVSQQTACTWHYDPSFTDIDHTHARSGSSAAPEPESHSSASHSPGQI